MKHFYFYASLLLSGVVSVSSAFAQGQGAEKVKQKIEASNGTPAFIEFKTNGQAYRSEQATQVLQTHLNLSSNDDMRPGKSEKDELGFQHQRYNQYYKGVKVEHGTYIVHSKGGVIHSINGELKKLKDVSASPALSEKAALASALSFVGAKAYMWQDPEQEAWIKEIENNKKATFYPKGELVFVENALVKEKGKDGELVLAWKFDIYAQTPLSRDYVYVDAATGKVVFKDAIIKHATATGTAATRYSGSRSITTDSYNGSYRLREFTRGNGIETYNCKTGTSYSAAVDFTDNDNNWTSAEYNNTAKDNAALDAHWAAQMTYDYFKLKHNRNSYDNAGAKIKSYVHYDKNYENAFWNGSVMTYGDGATRFDALTSLDVGAHEIGHAVCSNSANLVYQNESGAMNEGFSDIWGAAVEHYAAPEKSIWLIGEDIDKQRPSLRSMSDPNAEGQPDTYKGDHWYSGTGDNGGVHYNSGVLNHWFYILSVGKSGATDFGVSFNVAGIGITDAARIAYRTETVYLTSNSVYADARTYSIQSAIDLFGAGSNQVIQTTNAWNAVGIGGKYGEIAYCTSQGNNASYEWIAKVAVGTFSNSSTGAGYTDFTGKTVSVTAGNTYAITLTPGFASSSYNEYWKIWIDYNKDGDFDDAGELAFNAGALSSSAVSGSLTVPSSASGTTRMRVSMKYNGAQTQCESFSYGEVEDYTISISGATATCATPGSLSASNISSSSATLNWAAVSGASSYTVRFRPTGTSTWTSGSVTGTSASATGLSASTQYEFQVSTVCSGSSSAFSSSSTFTTAAAASLSYCASNGKDSGYEWIDLVEYGGFSNPSGNDGGYKNNTGITANVGRGASTTIYISAGFASTKYTEYWKVWIDFNQDGDFDDSGELVVSGSSSSDARLSASFTIPSTATLGKTRMRVSMKYNSAQTQCESFSYGEVEDYSVNIGTAVSELAAASNVQASKVLGNEPSQDLVVYPNPASSHVQISLPVQNAVVKVISMTGQKLIETTLRKNKALDISSLPAGVYIISVHDGQKEVHQRIVKQ